jgi:hypothetical protein
MRADLREPGGPVRAKVRIVAERRMERLGHEQPGRTWPQIHHLVGPGTECDHGLGLTGLEHIEKLVPPVLNPEDRNPNDPVEIVVPMRTTHP